jgi:hypothetical protein
MPESIYDKYPLWDDLDKTAKEITEWYHSGYECFAVETLEDYVQTRIRAMANNVINPTAPE